MQDVPVSVRRLENVDGDPRHCRPVSDGLRAEGSGATFPSLSLSQPAAESELTQQHGVFFMRNISEGH